MTNIFQGKLVRLRVVEPSDWETHFQWNMDTDGGRLTDEIWFPSSSEAARRWAEEQSRRKDGENFRFQIERVSDSVLVGTLNTHDCNPRCGTFMCGLAMMPQYQRQGYGAEAVRLVLRYYFHERRYQKVNAEVYAFNEPSIRFHQYLGFVQEGRLRRMIYSGGEFPRRADFWHDPRGIRGYRLEPWLMCRTGTIYTDDSQSWQNTISEAKGLPAWTKKPGNK